MNLFYREIGNGQPLVILHGLYGSSDNWMMIARRLAENYRCILVDHRNHGSSPNTATHTYNDMVTDLAWLLNELEIEKAHFLGHSMGGKVAIAFAADYPEHILSLTVADIAPVNYLEKPASAIQYDFHKRLLKTLNEIDIEHAKNRTAVEKKLTSIIPEAGVRKFIMKNLHRTNERKFEWKINVKVLMENLDHIIGGISYTEYEERIPITLYPVLFIRGDLSGYITHETEVQIKQMYPDSKLVTIKDASHLLHAEKPEEFAAIMLEFLATVH